MLFSVLAHQRRGNCGIVYFHRSTKQLLVHPIIATCNNPAEELHPYVGIMLYSCTPVLCDAIYSVLCMPLTGTFLNHHHHTQVHGTSSHSSSVPVVRYDTYDTYLLRSYPGARILPTLQPYLRIASNPSSPVCRVYACVWACGRT